ncbi:MAG: alpha/beta hydrolase [Usitatibacter sp.]
MQFIVQGYPAYAYTGSRDFDPKLPTIVFVHGAAFDHSVWQWQSRYFAHHGFNALAVDLPGHGRSPGLVRASIGEWSSWLIALLDAAAVGNATLVGHSMGSLVTLEATLAAPQRVSKLALIGTSAPMPVGEAFINAARDDPPVAFDMEAVWGHVRNSQLTQSAVPGTSLLGASRSLNGRSRPGALLADLAACNAYRPLIDSVRAIKVPTLVLAGKRDQMTQFKAGKALAAEIPGARFVAIDAGHSMMSEAPRATLAALRDFVHSRGETPA